MAKTQFAVQMGMGTDLKGQNYTKAAALDRNFLTTGAAFGFPLEAMIVDIRVGVGKPECVDLEVVKAEAPVGTVHVEAVLGGLDTKMMGHMTIIANAIVTVSFDVEKTE